MRDSVSFKLPMRILVVEDEVIISGDIESMLTQFGYLDVLQALNYNEAINLINTVEIDLAIIDINLSGLKTGIDVANYLTTKSKIPFIFLTSNVNADIVNQAIETKPNAYLTKPISETLLFSAIQLAINSFVESKERNRIIFNNGIFLKDKEAYRKVLLDEIIYCKSENVYLDIHTQNKTYTIRVTFQSFIDEIIPDKFIRTHRSYLVNFDYIQSFTHDEVIMLDKTSIPLSPTYKGDFMNSFKKFS